jgi:hypothetical protein
LPLPDGGGAGKVIIQMRNFGVRLNG